MNASLLNRLPDILKFGTVLAREALAGLDTKADCASAQAKEPRVPIQYWNQQDLPAMLDMLRGTNRRPSQRRSAGFVCISSVTPEAPQGASPSPGQVHERLVHLVHRLFVVRELMSPRALLAVAPAPGLADCTAMLMEAVMERRPQWTVWSACGPASRALVCQTTRDANPPLSANVRPQRATATVADWLRCTAPTGSIALAFQPHAPLPDLLDAWRMDWIVTHPDQVALGQLSQAHQNCSKPMRSSKFSDRNPSSN
jgi:hypothetical protein